MSKEGQTTSGIDQLAAKQKETGGEIERCIINYKKDSQARKDEKYLQTRLANLEKHWSIFEEQDNQIRLECPQATHHAYFAEEYYTKIKGLYEKYQDELVNKLSMLQLSDDQSKNPPPETQQAENPTKTLQADSSKPPSTLTIDQLLDIKSTPEPNVEAQGAKPKRSTKLNQDSQSAMTKPPAKAVPPNFPGLNITPENVARLFRQANRAMDSAQRLLDKITTTPISQKTKAFCDLHIQNLTNYWNDVLENHRAMYEELENPASMGYQENRFFKLEDMVHSALINLNQLANKVTSTSFTTTTPAAMKLPKVTLPVFDGDYLKWRQFHDLFTQMIHNQPMGPCQKMWYLKTNLTGEAERLIRHLPLSDENYTTAWTILVDRYENTRLLVTALLNKLLFQSTITTESANAIKTLHDTTQECMMGLQNLGIDTTSWGPLILHIILRKLDRTTHALYEQSLAQPKQLQSLKGFLQFLETRFQALEALGTKSKSHDDTQRIQRQKPSSFATVTNPTRCIICKQGHQLFSCSEFLAKSPSARLQFLRNHNLCINCMRPGHTAFRCTLRGCPKCPHKHNSLVHIDSDASNHPKRQPLRSSDKGTGEASKYLNRPSSPHFKGSNPSALTTQAENKNTYVLLSTVLINIIDNNGTEIPCRAILDSGSQLNFITKKMAKRLRAKPKVDSLSIQGIGNTSQKIHHRINIAIKSRTSAFTTRLEVFTLPQITSEQPSCALDIATWPIPKNIQLADPEFNHPATIDMLIGADLYFQLLAIGQIKLGDNLPTLQNTVFGWVVAGRVDHPHKSIPQCGICTQDDARLEAQVEKFWKLEETESPSSKMSPADLECESHFTKTMKRDDQGRFVVNLPFAKEPKLLGDSKEIALLRFHSLERKLTKNPQLKELYQKFMNEYIELGHMKVINDKDVVPPKYFIPHHSVLKPDSTTTKLRVVFDASAKTSTNVSLNDILYTGPSIQEDLFSVLLRFRTPRFVFTTDIEKMYRQVWVNKDDRKYQMILWRDEPHQPIQCYQLCTVTYGVTTAPYLAIRCLHQLAAQARQYPLASQIIRRNCYVDDIMAGANTLHEARDMQQQLLAVLHSAGFNPRKWCSNHPSLVDQFAPEDRAIQLDISDENDCHIKTLGVTWLPKSDEFAIKTIWQEEPNRVTKRRVLSEIAHLFDPLGLMGPVVVKAKIFLQELWSLKLDWDSAVPMELHTQWIRFRSSLSHLNEIKIPRNICSTSNPKSMQLHTFSDASEKAYGAAVYVRSIHKDGTIRTRLLCAKSRVAPLKKVTLPRLELCAAKLAADLLHRVKGDLQWSQIPYFMWTDSEVVLSWLNSPSALLHTFVANRVASIQNLTPANNWRHVPSKDNPADLISRGANPERLKECTLWFYGPLFLHGPEEAWPIKAINPDIQLEKRHPKRITLTTTGESKHPIDVINNKNSFNHLQRVMAYILRFIRNSRQKTNETRKKTPLSASELDDALKAIVKEVQRQGFPDDLTSLQRTRQVCNQSVLKCLSPFIDDDGIVRVGGRLEASALPFDAKHPMLLPYLSPVTKLIMTSIHITNSHAGPQALLSITRQKFWPIQGKTLARGIVHKCIQCCKLRPKLLSQVMGNLPPSRVQPSRPFVNAGVDFCGPFWIHYKVRGKRPQKCYVAIFCCFATKAIHIEVVSDLTTEAFIGALKRFVSRRGNCRHLHCDNATNFVGAWNQLRELQESIYSKTSEERLTKFCTARGMDFHFIPPRAPHFGGLWEAAVKSAKHLMQRSIAGASTTYEELETIMVEIEAILNSRPLTPMSNDPNDLSALTPGHFLIGEPLTGIVDQSAEPLKVKLLQRWKMVAQLKNEFWRRWTREYLSELQHRYRWNRPVQNVEPGTMVLVKDENLPVLKWPLARIIKCIKGEDGFVRVVDIKTSNGVLRRPIHKLAPLPIEQDKPEPTTPSSDKDNSPPGSSRRPDPDPNQPGPSGMQRQ